MRLFLVRHGETEHNVAGLLAGVTDSRLTNHGLLQAQRLGTYLVKRRQFQFSQVFASDLQRAARTAKEICEAQTADSRENSISPICLPLLREQDFGSFELLPWNRSQEARQNDPKTRDPDFRPKETAAAMKVRADSFLEDYLLPLLALDEDSEQNVAVVSHGLFLAALWRALLLKVRPSRITLGPDVMPTSPSKPLEYMPAWSNTGFLELLLSNQPSSQCTKAASDMPESESEDSSPVLGASLKVCAVNSKDHLANLKRTRGGVGSSATDDKQKRLENFFKKPKLKPV